MTDSINVGSNIHIDDVVTPVDFTTSDQSMEGYDIQSCDEIMEVGGRSLCRPYNERRERATEGWRILRDVFFQATVEEEGLCEGDLCRVCFNDEAVYRCNQCLLRRHSIHIEKCQIHAVEKKEGRSFKTAKLQYKLKKLANCCSSSSPSYFCKVVLTALQGSQHEVNVEFCHCEPEAIFLMRRVFFPATPSKPELAFSINLLKWLETLFLESHLSLLDFGHSINFLLKDMESHLLRNAYLSLLDAFEEFRFLQHRLRNFASESGKVECPACPKNDGTLTVGVDACFGIPCKATAGVSYRQTLQRDTYSISQKEVCMTFCPKCPKIKIYRKNEECSNFKAGAIINKGRYDHLDETAVFGMACKRGFPLEFINLKDGERFQNVVFLLRKLQERCTNKDIAIDFVYDVDCQLKRYLKAKYSPRRLPGWGMADGEMLERLWSYLRLFSRTTKEMSASHRIDVLCSAFFNFARKLLISIVNISLGVIDVWVKDEKDLLKVDEVSKADKSKPTDWNIEYKELLEDFYIKSSSSSLSLSSRRQVARLERKLVSMEVQHKVKQRCVPSDQCYKDAYVLSLRKQLNIASENVKCSGRQRWFCCTLMKKYSDVQAAAKRLSKAMNTEDRNLKKMVSRYNAIAETLPQDPRSNDAVSQITLEEARNIEGSIYNDCVNAQERHVPPALKRKAVDTFHVLKRCGVKIKFSQKEMQNVLKSFVNEVSRLHSQVTESVQSKYDVGAQYIIECKIATGRKCRN